MSASSSAARPGALSATPPGTASKYSTRTRRPVNSSSTVRSPRLRNGSSRSNTSDFLTLDVAARHGLSPGRVSQLRREFFLGWGRWCDEPPVV